MKRKLTFAALFLCTLMTFAQFSGSGSGTENDPYLILNPIQLNQMRNYLNQSGVYFKLMANIDLTDFLQDENPTQGWQPVGSSSSAAFKGILDGNGKTVSGLWINRSNTDNVALFGYTNGAIIKNIKVTGASLEGKDCTGGIVGTSESTTFTNCTFTGEVKGASRVGGIVAKSSEKSVLSNCRLYDSQVIGKDYVGGACGDGGNATSFSNCYIYSNIVGDSYVGGICGNSQPSGMDMNMNSCGYVGNISANSNAGGLIGRYSAVYVCLTITNCFVIGEIMAISDYVGGLIGSYEAQYTDPSISHCYFSGIVSGNNNVGGLIGYKRRGNVSCCYSAGSVFGSSNVGGLIGHNDVYSTIKTSVAIHSRISASVENVNRIVGKNSGTIAAVGSTDENRSYNRTIVMLKGAVQEIEDNQMNGTGVSATTLKLKATYVAMGWDFTDTWAIQETECYPYMKTQTAPPVITSDLVSNATTISGKCVDGGTVTMEIDGETKKQVSAGHSFSFAVNPLQSGHTVRISAKVDGKEQSYYTEQVVSYPGKGTEQDPYLVYTADDLTGVYRMGYYKLMNDIDLTEWINTNSPTEGWTGIGRDGSDMSQFDGNGFTISGLWSNSTRDYVGLFSMFSNGTIKNLNVKTAAGKKVKGGNSTGILIGYNTNGRIIDCSVEGDVQGTTNVGGVVGSSKNNELTNLVFDGGVTSSTASACIGGIAGLSENDQITGCYSDATMTTSGESANMGGIAGKANSHIAESVSKGTLTATGANAQVGGIVGTSQAAGIVEDCFSSAALTSTYAAAGIVSYNYGSVTRSLATGNLSTRNYAAGVVGYNDGASATISKSVATCNKIDVTYESQQVQQGGGYGQRIIGGIKNGAPAPEMDNYALKTMQVSVNDVSQKVYNDIMNGTSKTMDELNSQSTYAELGWNFSSIWYMNAGTGLPDLNVNQEKTEQTLALTEIPAMKYGDGTYQLPAKTNEGLNLTWTVGNSSVVSISGNVLTIKKAGTTSISATQDGNSGYKGFKKSFTLTVAKAPLTITAEDFTIKQGEALPTFEVSYDGFKNADTRDVLKKQPAAACAATSWSDAGTYDITVDGAEAENYSISYVKGTLTIVEADPFTLTYKVDGKTYKTVEVKYGATITPEQAPTKEGYTFSGWSEIPETMPAKDVIVTGSFTVNKYNLTYKVDGETYKTAEMEYGSTITPETAPTKEGYTFSGWSEIPETMPAKDVTVTGLSSKGEYQLTYIVDGKVYKTIRMDYGNNITAEIAPEKDGYTFSGWSEIPATMPAKDVTVTGNFTVNKYTLTYKVDGKTYKTAEVEYGATITAETAPTKEGYTFSGWSEIPETMPAKDVIIMGSFTVNKYTLTYKVDGDTYKTAEVEYCADITPEQAPTKEGYTFSGWSEIPETMPAKDVIVTGSFTVNKYNLTYKVDGETYKTAEVEYGADITPETAPTKEGYTFSGWTEIPETMPAKDVTVTGSFTLIDAIEDVIADDGTYQIYTVDGKPVEALQKGVNIIKYQNGTTKKVMVK
ncbi:MAG: InlB B-repeat-containing protein [Bacteroidaceae bacterium]|nr:InlB B-repeat-containing protein [Bacteroidaceae bacterium]